MLIKTRGIVLRALKYSETSLIADVYTEAAGLQTYIVSGVRKRGGKTRASLLQVMSLLEVVAYYREGRTGMQRVREMRPAYVYQAIPFDMRRSAIGQFMTEVARRTLREPEENPALFRFLYGNYRWLDRSPHPVVNLHLHFLAHFAGYLGFQPGGTYSADTPCFDLREGVFASAPSDPTLGLGPPLAAHLDRLLRLPLQEAHTVPVASAERPKLLTRLLDYYRLHIENFSVHSHQILHDVLG